VMPTLQVPMDGRPTTAENTGTPFINRRNGTSEMNSIVGSA
jgi:hypothetical protein